MVSFLRYAGSDEQTDPVFFDKFRLSVVIIPW